MVSQQVTARNRTFSICHVFRAALASSQLPIYSMTYCSGDKAVASQIMNLTKGLQIIRHYNKWRLPPGHLLFHGMVLRNEGNLTFTLMVLPLHVSKKLAQVVSLLTCIWEVPTQTSASQDTNFHEAPRQMQTEYLEVSLDCFVPSSSCSLNTISLSYQ